MALRKLTALAALTVALAGCGAGPALTGTATVGSASAQAKGDKATADRPLPPETKEAEPKATRGTAARRAADYASEALYQQDRLLRDWHNAWSDREKDRVEQRMLDTLYDAVKDVQRVTSGQGYDSADRRAYDIADRCLDRYDDLRRDWSYAWGDREKREITNRMLNLMVDALKDIKRNY